MDDAAVLTPDVRDDHGVATFAALFAARVASRPDVPVLFDVSVQGGEVKAQPYTWAEVDARARAAAAVLQRSGVASGERVVLCVLDPGRFFAYFLGAQAIGAIPVPLPSPSDLRARDAFHERVGSVVKDCLPRAIVVDAKVDGDALDSGLVGDIAVVQGDPPLEEEPAEARVYHLDREPSEIAYIQYTSGSTGSPKGVLVTHANLIANLRAIARGAGLGSDDIGFNWLPLYHDMGLIGGLLLGLYCGGGSYLMPTRTFISRPTSWLRAMSRFKATFAAAPNFAFSLLAKHLRDDAVSALDLSHWRRAFNGAEPIDRATLDAFMQRFAAAGFRASTMCPVYGLAECTLAVSIPAPGSTPRYDFVDREVLARERCAQAVAAESPSAACFVSVGRPVPEHRVRIVEPGGSTEVPERHIGEVVVEGPSVTSGYFDREGRSGLSAREARTGDLGYLADGELYIVDRLKDLVIIGGRNLVPSDVERVVAGVPGIRYGAVVAFSLRGAEGSEELYIVAGAAPRAMQDPETPAAVKAAVYRRFAVVPKEVVLVAASAIPKTSSGKIGRAACRELYQRGALTTADVASAAT